MQTEENVLQVTAIETVLPACQKNGEEEEIGFQ